MMIYDICTGMIVWCKITTVMVDGQDIKDLSVCDNRREEEERATS